MKRAQTNNILRHWHEAIPNDRIAPLIRDTERAFKRALQIRLADYGVPLGQWAFCAFCGKPTGSRKKTSAHAQV